MNTTQMPPKTILVGFRCPESLARKAKPLAQKDHRTLSNLLVKMLAETVTQDNGNEPREKEKQAA